MATHIKFLLDGFLEGKKKNINFQVKIKQIIKYLLGKEIEEYTSIKRASRDQLTLSSSSSGGAYNLNLQKDKLLLEVKKVYPNIKQIKIEVG